MSETKQIEVVELAIAKLDVKPGETLAIIASEEWTPRICAQVQAHLEHTLGPKLFGVTFVVFPNGVELKIISRSTDDVGC